MKNKEEWLKYRRRNIGWDENIGPANARQILKPPKRTWQILGGVIALLCLIAAIYGMGAQLIDLFTANGPHHDYHVAIAMLLVYGIAICVAAVKLLAGITWTHIARATKAWRKHHL